MLDYLKPENRNTLYFGMFLTWLLSILVYGIILRIEQYQIGTQCRQLEESYLADIDKMQQKAVLEILAEQEAHRK